MKMQTPLTFIAPIRYGEYVALKTLLQVLGKHPTKQKSIDFPATGTYFGRLVVLDNDPHYRPLLMAEATFDGSLDDFLDRVIGAAPGLDEILGKCEGYPPHGTSDPPAFKKYIRDHSVSINTFYSAYKQITLPEAKDNLALRQRIESEVLDPLDNQGKLMLMTPVEIRKAIQDWVAGNVPNRGKDSIPYLTGFDKIIIRQWPPPGSPIEPGSGWREYIALYDKVTLIWKWVQSFFEKVAPIIVQILLFPYLVILRRHEKADTAAYVPPPAVQSVAMVQQFQAIENQITQNQMTHLVEVRPGGFRLFTLSVVLWAINFLAKKALNAGRLSDVVTVHFARWLYINDKRRLLFTSNFDGPWSAYVGDFVDRTSGYLTAIWTNTANFPPTKDLVLEGAQDIDGFGWFLRINQLPTELFYSSFKADTAVTIVSVTQINQDMNTNIKPAPLQAWLRRF